jgi:hypothetical protein
MVGVPMIKWIGDFDSDQVWVEIKPRNCYSCQKSVGVVFTKLTYNKKRTAEYAAYYTNEGYCSTCFAKWYGKVKSTDPLLNLMVKFFSEHPELALEES